MRNIDKRIAKNLNDGFDQIAPDILSDIREELDKEIDVRNILAREDRENAPGHEAIVTPLRKKVTARKLKGKSWQLASAAAVLLICGALIGQSVFPSYAGEIYIDSNPSIVMSVDEDNQVCRIDAANEDAKPLIDDITDDVNYPMSAESAVNLALDGLGEAGYLKEDDMDVIISYCYKDKVNQEVENEILQAASSSLSEANYEYQNFNYVKSVDKEAAKCEITPGKYYYIKRMADEGNKDIDKAMSEYADKPICEIHKAAGGKSKSNSDSTANTGETKVTEKTSTAKESTAVKDNGGNGQKASSSTKASAESKTNNNQKSTKDTATAKSTNSSATKSTKNTSKHSDKKPRSNNNKHKSKTDSSKSNNGDSTDSTTSTATKPTKRATVVSTYCSDDGTVKIHFSKKVDFSKSVKVIVTDSEGNIVESSVKEKRRTYMKISTDGMSSNTQYTVTIAGVKGESEDKYRSVSTKVKAHTIK